LPLVLSEQGLDELILVHFRLARPPAKLQPWRKMVETVIHPEGRVTIAVVGKYSELQDAYKSIFEAIHHGALAHKRAVDIVRVAAEELEEGRGLDVLKKAAGILVPGGFGERGLQGKIDAIRFARMRKVPFFGICLGMQMAVVEFARNVCGLKAAHTTEVEKQTPDPVVCLMEEQQQVADLGATMRLGAWPCILRKGSRAAEAYGATQISERHRHRYEFNNQYRARLEARGLVLAGLSPDGKLVEIVEIKNHPWFLGCQFHPEFKSAPLAPHPLFKAFVGAAIQKAKDKA
jgi:CTP synthase